MPFCKIVASLSPVHIHHPCPNFVGADLLPRYTRPPQFSTRWGGSSTAESSRRCAPRGPFFLLARVAVAGLSRVKGRTISGGGRYETCFAFQRIAVGFI